MTPGQELADALASPGALLMWCAGRGYEPAADGPPLPPGATLAGSIHLKAPAAPRAPRLLLIQRPDLRERNILGNRLREIQIEANADRTRLRAGGMSAVAPALCLLAGGDFLVAFPLDGNAYARRMRFTPGRLTATIQRPDAGTLVEHFNRFNASTFAGLAQDPGGPGGGTRADALRALARRAVADLVWPWDKIFVGSKLDESFVGFMRAQRNRIAQITLVEANREALLAPMWRLIGESSPSGPLPAIASLVKDKAFRSGLIAAVDTVLLRLVLYRYLEAQFGYTERQGEEQRVALGSFDELLQRTTEIKREDLVRLIRKFQKDYNPPDAQIGLFAPVKLTHPEEFVAGVTGRAERYQSIAGGDLHQGRIAEAADVLQAWLLGHHREEFALLLAGTSTDDYSFHYADLEAQALQSFYEDTIGTDIRITYDPKTRAAAVGVADHQKNRKEQGAYYTGEKMCASLVERTIGSRFEIWLASLDAAVKAPPADRRHRVAQSLGELLSWRILDPTCGGGMFLRAAFEYLSGQHRRVREVLKGLSSEALNEVTASGSACAFASGAAEGEWQWHILLHMLHGVDVDVKAVNVASNLLTLSALTYKPNGICFPSFVNVSLKQGNALIAPLRPEERAEFLAKYNGEILQLIDLRAQLRDPNLERSVWKARHLAAAIIAKGLVEARIVLAYKARFPVMSPEKLIERVRGVGVFLYEVEFPEAFFTIVEKSAKAGLSRKVVLRADPGFDFILGNPPWEEPAKEFKQFLPDYDPEYLELSGQASKDRETTLLADPEIAARWLAFQRSVDDYKVLLDSGWYHHQSRKVKGRFPGAHTNLYKYATEMTWQLLVGRGAAGIVTHSGLWQDLAANGLRALLLDQCEVRAVCGFVNTERIFPDVEPRQRFCINVFAKGGRTETLPAIFMRTSLDDLQNFDALAARIQVDDVRGDARDCYPVPELKAAEQWMTARALSRPPSLDSPPWNVYTYSRELNAGEQREYFHTARSEGFLPLVQGTQFNIFGVHFGDPPEAWLDPDEAGAGGFIRAKQTDRVLNAIADYLLARGGTLKGGRGAAAREWVFRLTGSPEVPAEWVQLDWEGYRIAWRDVVRSDDRRTLIAAVVPRRVGLAHTAPYIRPFRLKVTEAGVSSELQYELPHVLFLAGMLSSFAADAVARPRLGNNHLSSATFRSLPVPPFSDTPRHRRVAELAARLTCLPPGDRQWADYTDLAASVGLVPERDGLTDTDARQEAEIELNALAAAEYGLGRREFAYLMDTLFMTPKYRELHGLLKDRIAAAMPAGAGQ